MGLSNKQIKYIKKEYPKKSVEQLSRELNLKTGQIYKVLGLQSEMRAFRLDNLTGYLACIFLLIAPFVFIKGLSNFADLPQRVFIQAATVCLLLLWVLRGIVKAEIRVPKNPIYLVAAAFIFWSFATLLWAHNRYEAFYSAVHWAACGAVFFAISNILYKDKWIELILTAIFAAAAGVVLLGLGQQFFKLDWVPMMSPPSATFANPNMASHYVAIVLPLVLSMGFYKRKSFLGYTAWMVAILSVLFIFYTRTRASWVAVACALIWMGLVLAKKRFGTAFILKAFAVIFIALIVFAVTGLMSGRVDRVIKKAGGSAKYRLIVWENSLEMVKEKPLQGFGAGSFKVFYPSYTYKAEIDKAFDKAKQIRRVHNDYIQTAVEMGIPGFLLFIALPLYGLFMAWQLIHPDKDSPSDRLVPQNPLKAKRHVSKDVLSNGKLDPARPSGKHDHIGVDGELQLLVIGISAGIVSFMATAFFSFPLQRSMPLLIVFTYLSIIAVLYNRCNLGENILKLRMPKALGIIALVILLVSGGALIRFNWRNIICDRYFHTAMSMEKRRANRLALTAGLNAHKYNKYRTDVLSTVGRAYVTTGNLTKGIEVLREVTSRCPYNLNALFILGAAYSNSGNKEKALETFRQVLKIKPRFPEAKKIISSLKAYGKVRVKLR